MDLITELLDGVWIITCDSQPVLLGIGCCHGNQSPLLSPRSVFDTRWTAGFVSQADVMGPSANHKSPGCRMKVISQSQVSAGKQFPHPAAIVARRVCAVTFGTLELQPERVTRHIMCNGRSHVSTRA